MKSKWTLIIVSLLLLLVGCNKEESSKPTTEATLSENVDSNNQETEEQNLTLDEALELLEEAAELENSFYSRLPVNSEEVFRYLGKIYTNKYIERIILESGNLTEKDGKWSFAYEGSEFVEGSYYHYNYRKDTKLQEIEPSSFEVVYFVEDSLYAAHTERITFVRENNTWKIDNLHWEY